MSPSGPSRSPCRLERRDDSLFRHSLISFKSDSLSVSHPRTDPPAVCDPTSTPPPSPLPAETLWRFLAKLGVHKDQKARVFRQR